MRESRTGTSRYIQHIQHTQVHTGTHRHIQAHTIMKFSISAREHRPLPFGSADLKPCLRRAEAASLFSLIGAKHAMNLISSGVAPVLPWFT